MKKFIFIIIMTLIYMQSVSKAQLSLSLEGNCDSYDTTLHYDTFLFIKASLSSYTHVFSFYCNLKKADFDIHLQKEFFEPFNDISYNNVHFALDSIVPHLIYCNSRFYNKEYIIELNSQGLNAPIAYIYGSDNVTPNPSGLRQTLSYLVSLDSNDQYASSYTQQELLFIQIYNNTSSSFYEIRDIDRGSRVVGFKYYSPTLQTEKIKFIVANN